ncbi:hypothetical protein [Alsobacter sp. SYSU BS001988]
MFSIIEYEVKGADIVGRRLLPMVAQSRAAAQIELRRYLNLFRRRGTLDGSTWWAETATQRVYLRIEPVSAPAGAQALAA